MDSRISKISEQKLKEMEAEMSRFEQEILVPGQPPGMRGPPGGNRMIIGANTYQKVKAKINQDQDIDGYVDEEFSEGAPGISPKIPFSVLAAPPPPPPSLLSTKSGESSGSVPPLAPPPPPPSFVPHQIRNRAPPMPRPPVPGSAIRPAPPGTMGGPPPPGGLAPPPAPPGVLNSVGPPGTQAPPGIRGPTRPMRPPGMSGPQGPPGPPRMPMGPNTTGPVGHVPPPFAPPNRNMIPANLGTGYGISSGIIHAAANAATPPVIQAPPKIVYSSAPTVRKDAKKAKKLKRDNSDTKTETVASTAPDRKPPTIATAAAVGVGMTNPIAQGPSALPPSRPQVPMAMPVATTTDSVGDEVVVAKKPKKEKKKKIMRTAAGETWEDTTLEEWDTDDFRIFCGDLGNEVSDEVLARAFSRFPSFQKAKVIRDKRSNKTKGYGFVSFKDPDDFVRAMREMNGKYVGNRPIKLRKSNWKDRNIEIVRKKEKEKKKLGLR